MFYFFSHSAILEGYFAIGGVSVCVSVCLSVCLSDCLPPAGIDSKLVTVRSCGFHHG